MARRLPRLSRGSTALAINAALALLALGLAFAPPGEGAPKLQLASATGSLSLSNTKEGAAIFHADAMRPGEEASGSVTITNTGTVNAALSLAPEAPADSPGSGGGKLSNKLELLVIDVTAGAVTVYAGTLTQMDPTDVGSLAPGAHRTYLFVASLRPSGNADNAFQGAALTTGFRWSASGAASPAPTPTPTSTPTATPTPVPSATPSPVATPSVQQVPTDPAGADPTGELLGAQLFMLPAAGKKCVSRRRVAIRVRRPKGTTYTSIAVTVNGRTKVRLKGLKAKKVKARVNLKGLPAGKVTVKITAALSNGRKAVSTRTYTTCAKKKRTR
ncbi:MAG TPA: hypothetical protein VFN44_01595 [Solirubrobacteraceae bacterium]|nr:hypothetical protein [Solirubrobacteraceae bacterium]